MKRLFIISLSLMILSNVSAVEIYKYISDSGREFYYTKNYNDNVVPTMDEFDFINAQIIETVVSTTDPNYNEDEIVAEAASAFKDSIRALYNENYEYMFRMFPENKYTFNEVYSIVQNFATTMIHIGLFDEECSVNVAMDIRRILTSRTLREKIEKYPYILGYLCYNVKYVDGKKCKIQSIPNAKVELNNR